MPTNHAASLVHLLGFVAGAALYAMLLVMVLRSSVATSRARGASRLPVDNLPLATALLGLVWNVGGLVAYAHRDLFGGEPLAAVAAVTYAALGFLPAVVVHAALEGAATHVARGRRALVAGAAYGSSALAALLHFYSAFRYGVVPSRVALLLLTIGFVVVVVALFASTRKETGWSRAVWAVALAIFAVTALHVGSDTGHDSWWVELVGHHASIPLALAILYQDYRFALADLFLKRALLLMALVAIASGAYALMEPLLEMRDASGAADTRAVGAVIGLVVATALAYPLVRGAVDRFVDGVVLGRSDYGELRADVVRIADESESPRELLDAVATRLAPALDAREVVWRQATAAKRTEAGEHLPRFRTASGPYIATLEIPTAEPPHFRLAIAPLEGGRRLLSDDVAMLEAVALTVARRIDALRVGQERWERTFREQEIGKLATEAELRALRAQLNPHFLFNALTTIGYLIQTAPERALETLMRLTGLLRAVLKESAGEFGTLGEELDLVEAYLAIERARFEDRLRVEIDVPEVLRDRRVPLLVLQPLVENAVKHGISPLKAGGVVAIGARLDPEGSLVLTVADSGAGVSEAELAHTREKGVGLTNVERRLDGYFGSAASLEFRSAPGEGSVVELRLPSERAPVRRESLAIDRRRA
jgi:signal transduction histidine kinase